MGCSYTLSGIPRDCEGAPGGIKRMLVIDHAQRGTYAQENGVISQITPAEGVKFAEIHFPQSSASLTSTLAVGDADNRTFNTAVAMNTGKLTATKMMQIQALLLGEYAVIVEGYDGQYWAAGFDGVPMKATEGAPTTGTATTDSQSTPATLSAVETHLPYSVDASIIAALVK